MRCGFVLPSGDAREAADLAALAERSGWDGFFVSEPVWGVDAWVTLAAAAMTTERIRLGTMLTPVSRRRPWKLASETAALDRLSGGRLILSVGLGAPDTGFAAFGEETDRRLRAELLDEGLDILTGLWRGQPFAYSGARYQISETRFMPPPGPLQTPRIPIWVAAAWPSRRSMARALRWDGLLPGVLGAGGVRQADVDELAEIVAFAKRERDPGPFAVVVEGETPADDPGAAADQVRRWADAGATWWIETRWAAAGEADAIEVSATRLAAGPPRPSADRRSPKRRRRSC